MAVYQATGIPAVSLPNGASSLPLEVLPLLERFEKVYLWMDHDGPGQAGVDKFVKKLVSRRARITCTSCACSPWAVRSETSVLFFILRCY